MLSKSLQAFFACAALAMVITEPACGSQARFNVELTAHSKIKTALESRLEISRWAENPDTSPAFFRKLHYETPARIKNILREYGYFAPEVVESLEVENGNYYSRFIIDPGERVVVAKVDIRFSGEILRRPLKCLPPVKEIKHQWELAEGEFFSPQSWETAKRRFLRVLTYSCYPAAVMTESKALIDPEASIAELSVTIDSGPAFTLGELNIEGLANYPESIVHNLNPIKTGEPYSREKLLNLQSRLRQSGYFEYADVRIDADPDFHENVLIKITGKEKKRREIRMGLEASSDTGAGARFEYRDLNLHRKGRKTTTTMGANRVEQIFSSDLQMPARSNGTYDNYDFTASNSDLSNEELNLLRFGFARSRPMGTFLRVFRMQYSRETKKLPDQDRTSLRSLTPIVSWRAHKTDHLLYPKKGYLLNIRTAGALEGLFADAQFLHLNLRAKTYLPLSPKDVLIFRTEAGHVYSDSREKIPSEFLFRTGGADTIRGYRYRSIGVPDSGAVVGGRHLLVGSIEYSRDIGQRLAGALFIDAGSAHDDWDNFKPVLGYGAGIRFKTAAGPLNLDIAYGEEVKKYRLHFTMGVIF